ncbi:MAG: protease inhibitor I42 family protein [Burkholderiales bacterium]
MKNIACIILSLLLLASALAGCAAGSAEKVYGKGDKDITVSVGGTFVIQLESNPTTGYEWTLNISDESIVKLENREYKQQPHTEGVTGAGGVDVLKFKGLKAGEAEITLVYERTFEEDSAVETLVYKVTVQ